jgi:hypothetical protein
MKSLRFALFAGIALAALTGCETLPVSAPYHVTAHRPHDPSAVRVKVSLQNQAVYVLEGDRVLMVAATCVGLPGEHHTPTGNFRAYNKIAKKRSGSYGFSISGNSIRPSTAGAATGRYVGYPMPYWVEFTSGYGFHEGYVWPVPRTHGCLRLHKEAAAKFYALVREGTPINIAQTQPEDATIGKNLARPTDYRDPDPAPAFMISDGPFSGPKGALFVD